MERMTQSGVSIAFSRTPPSCILSAWVQMGILWPGWAELTEERMMVDVGWQWQSTEESLVILFDLWSEPENETEQEWM